MPRQLMQSVRNGERLAGAGVLLGIVAVLCLLVASLGLTLDYRAELREVKRTVYERCLQREAYDRAQYEVRGGQAVFYESLLEVAEDLPPQPDPKVAALQERQVEAIRVALRTTNQALAEGIPQGCEQFR